MFLQGGPFLSPAQLTNCYRLKTDCPHIVVGTPGRILALARDKSLNLKQIKHFVLDECDKMLDQLGLCTVFCLVVHSFLFRHNDMLHINDRNKM